MIRRKKKTFIGKLVAQFESYFCIFQAFEEWSHVNKADVIIPHDGIDLFLVW